MKRRQVVLAIDQGTTGTRAILYSETGREVSSAYKEFKQSYPKPGWVEHDADEIWQSVLDVIKQSLKKARLKSHQINAIGITNQRETTLLWDKFSGKLVYPAIVWQDRRTSSLCNKLKKRGYEKTFRQKTGLVIDPYFSGTKVKWMLENLPGLKRLAKQGRILFGTVDSWIVWKLTGGKVHATDFTNASRTLLFNIKTMKWDRDLCKILGVPMRILPKAMESGALFGETVQHSHVLPAGIPIHAVLGDQQAALYGQCCYKPGETKNTYGTGSFIVTNLGKKYQRPQKGLLTTVACDREGRPTYALEGAIFITGAAVQWLRDGLALFKRTSESEEMAKRVSDAGGVIVIPALTGLGSPYWNAEVRGVISGLTRGTTREHIVRATLESIAQQTTDVVDVINKLTNKKIRNLRVDGGATSNHLLMQIQADLLNCEIWVSDIQESTAWGVAKLAGYKSGLWNSLRKIDEKRKYRKFKPKISTSQRHQVRLYWKKEVKKLINS